MAWTGEQEVLLQTLKKQLVKSSAVSPVDATEVAIQLAGHSIAALINALNLPDQGVEERLVNDLVDGIGRVVQKGLRELQGEEGEDEDDAGV